MIRIAVLGLTLASVGLAQYVSIASNSDGSIFRFAGRLALKDEPLTLNTWRIYQHGASPSVITVQSGNLFPAEALISADGLSQGTYLYRECRGSCMLATPAHIVDIVRAGSQTKLTGNEFRLSRNGRFLYDSGFPVFDAIPTMHDLDTGETRSYPPYLTRHRRHSISDDGALLSTEESAFVGLGDVKTFHKVLLTPFGKPSQLIYEGTNIPLALINAAGDTVILLQQVEPKHFRLLEVRVDTRAQSTLWEGEIEPANLNVSSDGNRVLMQWPNQLLIWDRTSGWRSLFTHDEGIRESLLTDNGNAVFAVTAAGRYFRIDADSSDVMQLYAPMPVNIRQDSYGAYPGSIIRLGLNYIPPAAKYRIGSYDLPPITTGKDFVDLQIPWEATDLLDKQHILEISDDSSPFALRFSPVLNQRPSPWMFYFYDPATARNYVLAVDAKFQSRITPTNPAHPSDLIHFYLTGLGPLDRFVPTGAPGPSDPPARPLSPLACYLSIENQVGSAVGLKLPAVIYAPSLVGVYQVDAIIPDSWPPGTANLSCVGEQFGTGALLQVAPR